MTSNLSENIKNVIEFLSIEGVTGYEKNIALRVKDKLIKYGVPEEYIFFDEAKKFGPLEIKILKCSKVNVNNNLSNVAYMQVKDLTKNENEKVYIFNGWTFSSDPNLTPFDHAIYDLQLLSCYNV